MCVGKYLAQKPDNQKAENQRIVRFSIVPRNANVAGFPKLRLPAVQTPRGRSDVKKNHFRVAVNQPASKDHLKYVCTR